MLSEILSMIVIPIYLGFIGIELLYLRFAKQKYYRLNDSLSSISTGVIQQIIGIFIHLMVYGSYFWIQQHISIQDMFGIPAIPENILWYVIAFLAFDFLYYWFHRISHEVNVVWASHVVHHSSEEYNLSTALRQGTFQGLFSWPFYLVMAFAGFPLEMFLVVSALNLLWQYFLHTRAVGKLGPLEWFMNTPSHHRVHHGKNPQYIDRNHAGALIIWDKMFGTFEPEGEEVVYGITKPLNSWNPLWANFESFYDLMYDAWHAKSWKDKFAVWFKPPGWRPANLPPYKSVKIDPKNVIKYDTEVPFGLNAYAFIQFVLALVFAVFVLLKSKEWDLLTVAGPVFLVVLSITNIGGLNDMRRWAFVMEIAKNITASVIMVVALQNTVPLWASASGALLYLGITTVWLLPFMKQAEKAKVTYAV
jgi:alkylglycerol monooxygenase